MRRPSGRLFFRNVSIRSALRLICILKTDPVFAADPDSHLSSNCGLQSRR